MAASGRLRILVLARNFPNSAFPALGLWTRRLVHAATPFADPTVIAPVPYAPPLLPFRSLAKFRDVPLHRLETGPAGDYEVHHPRIPLPPGHALQRFEAPLAWPFVKRLADRLHARQPFDLIHAHFIYPEGVMAARLGRSWGVPVVTTEAAAWRPWLSEHPGIRRSVLRALPSIRLVLPVSHWLQRDIEAAVGIKVDWRVVPNVVDDRTFTPEDGSTSRNADQLLFVGLIRHVKGLDLLVRALGILAAKRPGLRLLVIGGAFYRSYQQDAIRVRRLVDELGLAARVTFAGEKSPGEVAEAMRRSALVVVPSRRETFSVVSAEAIATGTPVVATRCGGPEELISAEHGVLVPPEDPAALAAGIEAVLARRASYDAPAMHRDMTSRFGSAAIGRCLTEVYAEARPRLC